MTPGSSVFAIAASRFENLLARLCISCSNDSASSQASARLQRVLHRRTRRRVGLTGAALLAFERVSPLAFGMIRFRLPACFAVVLFAASLAACGGDAVRQSAPATGDMPASSGRELIVLAAPRSDDPYYAEAAASIFTFQIAYARVIAPQDRVLVLTDKASYSRYAEALGEAHVAEAPMDDIWMRDFGLSNVARPVQFRYTAAGQGGGRRGQREAAHVQTGLMDLIDAAGLAYTPATWLNDGGNLVDDYQGNAVISRKFLRDNRVSEDEARAALKSFGLDHVAFIEADEQGGLEHADGVVAFVDTNTLIINSYPEDPDYARALRADLERGLPGVTLHEIVTPYNGETIYDERFGSACGLYTNALVTPNRIYLPQFGTPDDAVALRQVRAATRREVVPVASSGVCQMGGGVRCLSWQLRGEAADQLLAYLGKTG